MHTARQDSFQPNGSIALVREFEGRRVTTLTYNERECWLAGELGQAIGYGHGGTRFVSKITAEWSDELIDGTDYRKIEGAELADLKAVLGLTTDSVGSHARSVIVLFESGVNLALMKTHKPAGVRLRRWLADEVLPQIRRGGAVSENLALVRISEVLVKLTALTEGTRVAVDRVIATGDATAATVTKLEARVIALETAQTAGTYPHGVIARQKARELHGIFQGVADLSGHARKTKGWYGARRVADMATRQATTLGSRAWAMLDANELAAAWNKATELRGHAQGVADARAQAERDAKQRTIWDVMPESAKHPRN